MHTGNSWCFLNGLHSHQIAGLPHVTHIGTSGSVVQRPSVPAFYFAMPPEATIDLEYPHLTSQIVSYQKLSVT